MARNKLPVRVRIPGTDYFVWREAEGEKQCAHCRATRSCLFSYDDSCKPFCNIRHWMMHMVCQHGVGGSRMEDEVGKRPRRHKRRHLTVAAQAS